MNNQRRLPTQHEIELADKLGEIKRRKKQICLEDKLPNLAYSWNISQLSIPTFIINYLENSSRWLNSNPENPIKGKGITLGDMMNTRMHDYLEVLGYQPAEITDFFKLAGRVNENYKAPERRAKYSPTSLDSYEGLPDQHSRHWLLSKFKGELGK
ncbi:MAG: hypothetical protein Q7R87_03560 [Nanoarchaeota archaeon]|nr:hypothetical protein [Nanoarchaeota archaeon]